MKAILDTLSERHSAYKEAYNLAKTDPYIDLTKTDGLQYGGQAYDTVSCSRNYRSKQLTVGRTMIQKNCSQRPKRVWRRQNLQRGKLLAKNFLKEIISIRQTTRPHSRRSLKGSQRKYCTTNELACKLDPYRKSFVPYLKEVAGVHRHWRHCQTVQVVSICRIWCSRDDRISSRFLVHECRYHCEQDCLRNLLAHVRRHKFCCQHAVISLLAALDARATPE
jgi:hypothetical protein